MKYPSFLRHASFFGPTTPGTDTINIIGCGAVGSNLAITAAKMGFCKFSLWDSDTVADHNLPNQAFLPEDIGLNKAARLKHRLLEFNPDVQVEVFERFYEPEDVHLLKPGIVCMAADSMKARRAIYESTKGNYRFPLITECRIGFSFGETRVYDPLDLSQCKKFEESLFDDDKVKESACSERICTTVVQVISTALVHILCQYYASLDRSLVFKPASRTCYGFDPETGGLYLVSVP